MNKRFLIETYPEIAKEFDLVKNYPLTPYNISHGSHKNLFWLCIKGHSYKSVVKSRTIFHRGCPYCSGRYFASDNSFAINYPDILKEWDYDKNNISPYEIFSTNKRKVFWKCLKGHSWQAKVVCRTNSKNKCPYCFGKKASKENCLSIKNPNLLKEWDYIKNKNIYPENMRPNSKKKVWWICKKCNYKWKTEIQKRNIGNGCPCCAGKVVTIKNNLKNKALYLAEEWDYIKNKNKIPDNIHHQSNKNYWWICRNNKEHSWKASPNSRFRGNGCPFCNSIILKDGTVCASKIEAFMYLMYKKLGLNFKHNKKYSNSFGNKRYDFYFPEENKYVEVTSFNQKFLYSVKPGLYFKYLRNIVKKRRFVENILKAKFEFLHFIPSKEQRKFINENLQTTSKSQE
jgi:hypothetical protein